MSETTQLFIGGTVPAAGGATFDRRNPISGTGVTTAAAATVSDALAGVHEFTDLRWIAVQTGPRHYPF